MHKKTKILVADNHPLILKGLTEELTRNDYENVQTAEDGEKAITFILKHNPDIAILDIQMPFFTGFEVIKKCKNKKLDTKFIILTSFKENRYVLNAKILNISGYLLKDESFDEIDKCIQAINNGKTYFSSVFSAVYENQISPELEKLRRLSPSEITVLKLIANQNSTRTIAESLFVSVRTVQKHRTNIIAKLKLKSDTETLSSWAETHNELIFLER